MKFEKLPVAIATAALTMPTLAVADHNELEFDEAYLYFELNDTDGDLGIHGKVDGDAWKKVKIDSPDDRNLLIIRARSRLARQGLTELFFESAEPTFDELDPDKFFARFPQGVYEWEGLTTEYQEIEGEVYLSQIIPAAPVVTGVGNLTENPGFEQEVDDMDIPVVDEDGNPVVEKACWEVSPDGQGDVLVTWNAVTMSHRDMWDVEDQPLIEGEDLRYGGVNQPERKIPLGISGAVGAVEYYEFVAEIDDTEFKSTAVIPSGTTSWTVPAEIIALADEAGDGEVKFEIIVRVESGIGYDDDGDPVASKPGNQSAVEDCFEISGGDEE